MRNDELAALCAAAPPHLMCQAFRPGCENVATTFERGYALCVRCAREALGYTPESVTYPSAFYDAARTEIPRLLAEHTRLRTVLQQIAHDPYIDQNAAAVRELARKALAEQEPQW